MIADSHERPEFEGARWKAVRLGLRLANSHVGVLAIARFYLIWGLIGLILCVILIPFAVLGNMKAFEAALNPIALYGSGNVVVTGSSGNGINGDYYTAKYAAADGALVWEKRYNGPVNSFDEGRAVAVDGSGNGVVTGYSYNGKNDDYYTTKYAAADGALLWEKRYNGPANGFDYASSLALGPNGMVAVTGSSSGDYATVVYWETLPRSPSHWFPPASASVSPASPAAATPLSAPPPSPARGAPSPHPPRRSAASLNTWIPTRPRAPPSTAPCSRKRSKPNSMKTEYSSTVLAGLGGRSAPGFQGSKPDDKSLHALVLRQIPQKRERPFVGQPRGGLSQPHQLSEQMTWLSRSRPGTNAAP